MPQVKLLNPINQTIDVEYGTRLQDLSERYQDTYSSTIVVAKVDNDLKELTWEINDDCQVQLLDLTDRDGLRVYERGIVFLFVRAARELFPDCRLTIEHHVSNGIYGEIYCEQNLTAKDFDRIEQRMKELVEADEPFDKRLVDKDEAIEIFKADGQEDKVRLLRTGGRTQVKIYKFGWCLDSYYGYMVPSSRYLRHFKLRSYMPGFILQLPDATQPNSVKEYVEQRKLAAVFAEAEKWGRILGVGDVGALNEQIESGLTGDLVRVAEALHEKKIAQLADAIASERDKLRIILIAGPSSSGKTTFAQRLSVQLRVNGLKPVSISLDDYFVSRDETPLDEDGNPDFEALEAIDIDLFNEHLQRLIQGETVDMPTFNFIKGTREYRGRKLCIGKEEPIVIEGIHGLNDKLTESIPTGAKYRVYVSALTTLNLDDHNRIPTTDVRLLRRIVRDNQFRSHDALHTIRMWPSVRRGEMKNIFPYQENADMMFNSALVYELALLKRYAEPLLTAVSKEEPEFSEAKRLRKFIDYFAPIDDCDVPRNSIIREFIGDSCFC